MRAAFDRRLAIDALAAVVGVFALGWLGSSWMFFGAFLGATLSRVVGAIVARWRTRTIWVAGASFGLVDLWRAVRPLRRRRVTPRPRRRRLTMDPPAGGFTGRVLGVVASIAALIGAVATASSLLSTDTAPRDGTLAGHWVGDRGEHYFRVHGARFTVAYENGPAGRIVGTIDGDRLRGWWTEAPNRKPPSHAGVVEFRLIRDPDRLLLDGVWARGDTRPNFEGWNLVRVDDELPAVLAQAFDKPDTFVAGP